MSSVDSPPQFRWKALARGNQGPGFRSRYCLSYDWDRQATVLFGGIVWGDPTFLRGDTWELRAGRWIPLKCPTQPPHRHRGAMAYDRARGFTVLFGGQGTQNDLQGDTWVYAEGVWKRLRPPLLGSRPVPRCGHSMAYDESMEAVVLFGGINPDGAKYELPLGDTWWFDGRKWRPIAGPAPSPRRYAGFAYHPRLKGCLLHAGAHDDNGRLVYGDSWLLRDGEWIDLGSDFDTSPRDDQGMAFHRAANRMVITEGVAGERGLLVLERDGWHNAEVTPLHPRHQCAPMVWDEGLQGLVLHGGEVGHASHQFDVTMVLQLVQS